MIVSLAEKYAAALTRTEICANLRGITKKGSGTVFFNFERLFLIGEVL